MTNSNLTRGLLLLAVLVAFSLPAQTPPPSADLAHELAARISVESEDGFANLLTFNDFEKRVPPESRAAALVAVWKECATLPHPAFGRTAIIAYLLNAVVPGKLPSAELVTPLLTEASTDADRRVRLTALHFYAKVDPVKWRPQIVALLDDDDDRIRDEAVGTVHRFADGQALLRAYVDKHVAEPDRAASVQRARTLLARPPQ